MKTKNLLFILVILATIILTISGCVDEFKKKQEARGIWMSRFDYTNKDYNIEDMKSTIRKAFDGAKKSKFNMIIFQVRGNGDAFYRSDIEPWSKMLTGTLGKDPGWDPLQYSVDYAHQLGLELHVWLNTFPGWRANEEKPTESIPRQITLQHPEWIVCDKDGVPMKPADGYISLSPGIPEVREHITSVVMDIVNKYDVDGIHFDYIRYPEGSNTKGYSHDNISVARFNSEDGNPKKLDWENWQRDQVSEFVRGVYTAINKTKPWVKMSASTIGNYSKGGWNGYNIVYQNPKQWVEENKVDFIVPMAYMKLGTKVAPLETALDEWKTMSNLKDIYPGLAAYKAVGRNAWGWEEIWTQIKLVREMGFPGVVFFAMGNMYKVWDDFGKTQFPYYANVPNFKYKNDDVPAQPQNLIVSRNSSNQIMVKWNKVQNDKNNQSHYYNIYRSTSKSIEFETSENLIYVTAFNETEFADTKVESGKNYYYCVSALNRNNLEGPPSEIANEFSKPVALGK